MERPEISILLLTLNEGGSLQEVLKEIATTAESCQIDYELIIVDGGSTDDTVDIARTFTQKVIGQSTPGYAAALIEGIEQSTGEYIITLDADGSHPGRFISTLLTHREDADMIVGSRFLTQSIYKAPLLRKLLSQALNTVFKIILDLPVRDSSSGFRLYKRKAVQADLLQANNFSILQEILVHHIYCGYKIAEIPIHYHPRKSGRSHVHFIRFAWSYLSCLSSSFRKRNARAAADYDSRCYDSYNIATRYKERRRFLAFKKYIEDENNISKTIDISCGSTRIVQSLPLTIAMSSNMSSLRFLEATNRNRIMAHSSQLPFIGDYFDAVLHSQPIEELKDSGETFSEAARILRKDGTFIFSCTIGNQTDILNELLNRYQLKLHTCTKIWPSELVVKAIKC